MVRLSAPILTRPQTPAFTGSIEVNITAEDLPDSETRRNAQFGKHYLTICIAELICLYIYLIPEVAVLSHILSRSYTCRD